MDDLKKDYKHYLVLAVFLCFSLLGFAYFGYDRGSQGIIIVLTSFFYLMWGSVHHWLKGDFHLKVFLEYLVIAIFASVLMISVLNRA